MTSFNVKSLFTNVPLDEAINIINASLIVVVFLALHMQFITSGDFLYMSDGELSVKGVLY